MNKKTIIYLILSFLIIICFSIGYRFGYEVSIDMQQRIEEIQDNE